MKDKKGTKLSDVMNPSKWTDEEIKSFDRYAKAKRKFQDLPRDVLISKLAHFWTLMCESQRRKCNGTDVIHKENRAMKAEVFIWLDSNRRNYKSMDDTAMAITKQQPIKFRTARDWVGEWKKLRSASTL